MKIIRNVVDGWVFFPNVLEVEHRDCVIGSPILSVVWDCRDARDGLIRAIVPRSERTITAPVRGEQDRIAMTSQDVLELPYSASALHEGMTLELEYPSMVKASARSKFCRFLRVVRVTPDLIEMDLLTEKPGSVRPATVTTATVKPDPRFTHLELD